MLVLVLVLLVVVVVAGPVVGGGGWWVSVRKVVHCEQGSGMHCEEASEGLYGE